jgi:non-homologous end joining protein Ku
VVVEREDRVRGYEFAKGQYVQLTEAELESVETESSNNIELKEFIPLSKLIPYISRVRTTSALVKAERRPIGC